MVAATQLTGLEIKHPINFNDKKFVANKTEYYRWLRDNAPVYKGKWLFLNAYFVSRYTDCEFVLKDSRFVRNRSMATGGGSKLPFPLPKSIALMAESMIIADDPEHRRLRNLVHKAFTPRAINRIGERVDALSHELLNKAAQKGEVDLKADFALPIPVTVISEMVGVADEDMPMFMGTMRLLTGGFNSWNVIRTFWDMRGIANFIRDLIARKKADPQDDILTALIQAREDDGAKLSEDELISMVMLLVVAGYETTVHLITNSILTLLQHPDQFAMLQANRDLMDSAIEEVLRYHGPIEGTKPMYAAEDVTLHGVTIPRKSMVMTLLGAANHDERQFENPEVFDITRSPNPHMGFGRGIHYCLGAPLARLETKIALTNLFDRYPDLRLTVKPEDLPVQLIPMWHRYEKLPVRLG